MSETKPIPCPFCGMELKENMRGLYEDCNKECIMYCFELHPQDVPLWNTRKPLERIVERLGEMKMRYFLTIANSGSANLDSVYEEVGNCIDRAIEIVKEEGGL